MIREDLITKLPGRMVQLMRCCLILGGCYGASANADHATIENERTLLVNGIYRASAHVVFDMDEKVQEALDNGVPLVVDLEIELVRKRDWLWPEQVVEHKQRYMMYFHALSRRYIVKDVNKDVQQSYRYIGDALNAIGDVYDVPLIAADELYAEADYRVRMRALFDVEALPTPIRLWAYFSSDWKLTGGWTQWRLKP
jgi:hypothetical protein